MVLWLKMEFDNIILLSFDRLRVELVVAGSCDLDGLGRGKVSHGG